MSTPITIRHHGIDRSLLESDFDRLFGDLLGWSPVEDGRYRCLNYTAGPWPDDVQDLPEHFIGWQPWNEGSRLCLRQANSVAWIPIRAPQVEGFVSLRIGRWHADEPAEVITKAINEVFSARALAECLRSELLAFFDEFREEFRALQFSAQVFPSSFSPLSPGEQHGIAAIGKCFWLIMLQGRVDCDFGGNRSYLRAIIDDWEARDREPSLEARVTTSLATIMCDTSPASRALARDFIGNVPALNSWLVHPHDPETVVAYIATQSLLPNEFLLRLIGENGILWRYPIMLRRPRLHEIGVFICPELASGMLNALRKQETEIATFRLHERCQWEIAAHLGIGPELRELKPHHAARLEEFFVADPDCQTGQYVVAMLHELMIVWERVTELRGEEWQPIPRLRRLLGSQIRGYAQDITFVRAARVRLAQICLSWVDDTRDFDLNEISECFRIGSVAGLSQGPLPMDSREGPTIEFKSTFEWNKRLGQRDANIRQSVMRTITAFMNSQGGTIYIGVNDHGEAIGAEDDFALIQDSNQEDMFAQRLTELLRRNLEPYSPGSVSITFPTIAARRIVAIEVEGQPGITYLKEKSSDGEVQTSIYVRDGNRTLKLQGRERDRFVLQRFRADESP